MALRHPTSGISNDSDDLPSQETPTISPHRKDALRPRDHHHLNEVETGNLYDNIIHSAMESALCAYMAKEQNKALRWEFEAQKMDRLKAWVEEVENTVKETLESVEASGRPGWGQHFEACPWELG